MRVADIGLAIGDRVSILETSFATFLFARANAYNYQ